MISPTDSTDVASFTDRTSEGSSNKAGVALRAAGFLADAAFWLVFCTTFFFAILTSQVEPIIVCEPGPIYRPPSRQLPSNRPLREFRQSHLARPQRQTLIHDHAFCSWRPSVSQSTLFPMVWPW